MSSPTTRRTALVTGASSGIGAAVAAALVERGHRVYGTSRSPEGISDPIPGVEYLALDLTDTASSLLTRLRRGQSLWRIGQRMSLVQVTRTQREAALFDTDEAMVSDGAA